MKKSPLYSITIDRFRIDALIAKIARCGGYNLGFEAEVKITTNSLDDEGFVVHNEKLVNLLRMQFAYGTTVKEKCGGGQVIWRASCEELTSGIAHVIAQVVPSNRLIGMDIKVFNHMGHTSLSWRRGESVPKFPRLATDREVHETREHNRRHGVASVC